MRKLSLEEIKNIELDILCDINDFCEKNKIKYSLAYGTLLGCVRHKGFIPWDDDVDIWMPRPDYLRFVKEYKHKYYVLKSAETNDDYLIPFAKVFDKRTYVKEETGYEWSLFVDIFPVDGIGNDIEVATKHYKSIIKKRNSYNRYRNLTEYSDLKAFNIKDYFVKKATILANYIYPCKRYRQHYFKYLKAFNYESSSLVYDCSFGNDVRLLKKDMIEELTKEEFEEYKFYIPVHYDRWLRLIYGNYMQMPPEEDRIPRHGFEAFWIED